MKQDYSELLALPHPVSKTHAPMSRRQRAAQFAPFAALVGHEAAIAQTARLTERRIELDEGELAELDRRWRQWKNYGEKAPSVTVVYFEADKQKDGGAYLTVSGTIEKMEEWRGVLRVAGREIPLEDIYTITWEGL